MKDPRDVLTEQGVANFDCHLLNLDNAIFWFDNHWADLELTVEDYDDILRAKKLVTRLQGYVESIEQLRENHTISRSGPIEYEVVHADSTADIISASCPRDAAYAFGQKFPKVGAGWITVSNEEEGEAKFYLDE